jgi:hypothetical protein
MLPVTLIRHNLTWEQSYRAQKQKLYTNFAIIKFTIPGFVLQINSDQFFCLWLFNGVVSYLIRIG